MCIILIKSIYHVGHEDHEGSIEFPIKIVYLFFFLCFVLFVVKNIIDIISLFLR